MSSLLFYLQGDPRETNDFKKIINKLLFDLKTTNLQTNVKVCLICKKLHCWNVENFHKHCISWFVRPDFKFDCSVIIRFVVSHCNFFFWDVPNNIIMYGKIRQRQWEWGGQDLLQKHDIVWSGNISIKIYLDEVQTFSKTKVLRKVNAYFQEQIQNSVSRNGQHLDTYWLKT